MTLDVDTSKIIVLKFLCLFILFNHAFISEKCYSLHSILNLFSGIDIILCGMLWIFPALFLFKILTLVLFTVQLPKSYIPYFQSKLLNFTFNFK